MKDTWSLQCGRSTNSNFWFILFDFVTSHVRLCEGRVSEPEWEQRRPRPLFYVASTSQTLPLVPAAWCHSYSAFNTFSIITSINWISSEYLDRCVYYIECKWQHSELCNLHHQHPTILLSSILFYSILFYSIILTNYILSIIIIYLIIMAQLQVVCSSLSTLCTQGRQS